MVTRDTDKRITYIVKTLSDEYYCGITNNLKRRLKEHTIEKYPHWFCNDVRRKFVLIWNKKGDYEKRIKKFGVRSFVGCLG